MLVTVHHGLGLGQNRVDDTSRLGDCKLLRLLVRLVLVEQGRLGEGQPHQLGQGQVDIGLTDVVAERTG